MLLDDPAALGALTLKLPAATFYSIEIGRRGKQVRSFDDLTRARWVVSLSLGR